MPSDSGSEEYPRAPAQKARDENILGVFEATADPVLTTSEVAEELPIGKRATLNRLEDLVDRGELDSKDVGVGRVWWREPAGTEPDEPEIAAESGPEPARAGDPNARRDPAPDAPVTGGNEPVAAADDTDPAVDTGSESTEDDVEPLESESPRWAFIGSLGRHSILAGVFLLGLLLVEGIIQQALLPVSPVPVFLTAVVFFLIGFPARGAYRTKKYFESTDLSISQFVGPLGRVFGRDDSRS
ncbi:hypothetical protein [Halorientalis halophila]|uniref:hypothetical protein n=1 Tax=Halorientalis halophila TaxID=3108499 RepID=UPI00300ADF6B